MYHPHQHCRNEASYHLVRSGQIHRSPPAAMGTLRQHMTWYIRQYEQCETVSAYSALLEGYDGAPPAIEHAPVSGLIVDP